MFEGNGVDFSPNEGDRSHYTTRLLPRLAAPQPWLGSRAVTVMAAITFIGRK